jgi:hypothetical protein
MTNTVVPAFKNTAVRAFKDTVWSYLNNNKCTFNDVIKALSEVPEELKIACAQTIKARKVLTHCIETNATNDLYRMKGVFGDAFDLVYAMCAMHMFRRSECDDDYVIATLNNIPKELSHTTATRPVFSRFLRHCIETKNVRVLLCVKAVFGSEFEEEHDEVYRASFKKCLSAMINNKRNEMEKTGMYTQDAFVINAKTMNYTDFVAYINRCPYSNEVSGWVFNNYVEDMIDDYIDGELKVTDEICMNIVCVEQYTRDFYDASEVCSYVDDIVDNEAEKFDICYNLFENIDKVHNCDDVEYDSWSEGDDILEYMVDTLKLTPMFIVRAVKKCIDQN